MKEFRKGDIVVVTKRFSTNDAKTGDIGLINEIDLDATAQYSIGRPEYYFKNSWCEDVRLATQQEIDAYNQGIRNISEIKSTNIFIKGKWYKDLNTPLYIKFDKWSKFNKNEILSSQRIIDSSFTILSNDSWKASRNFILLEDLSEIQQYLPKNHEDLIKDNLNEIPKNWYINVTKPGVTEALSKYANDNNLNPNNWVFNKYSYYWPDKNRASLWSNSSFLGQVPAGSIQITLEEFKRLISKQTINKQINTIKNGNKQQESSSQSITVPTKSPKITRSVGIRTSGISGRRTTARITRYNSKNKAISSLL